MIALSARIETIEATKAKPKVSIVNSIITYRLGGQLVLGMCMEMRIHPVELFSLQFFALLHFLNYLCQLFIIGPFGLGPAESF